MTYRKLLEIVSHFSDDDLDRQIIVSTKDGDEITECRGIWQACELTGSRVSDEHGDDCPVLVIV